MSFIRCLSNPEGLYVYDGPDNMIYFNDIVIPENEFYEFFCKMVNYHVDFRLGDLEIKEEVFLKETIKIEGFPDMELNEFKFCLYYKGELIAKMWEVTWVYIYNNVMKTIKYLEKSKTE